MRLDQLLFNIWLNSRKIIRILILTIVVVPPVVISFIFLYRFPFFSPIVTSQEFQIKSDKKYSCYQYGIAEKGKQKNADTILSELFTNAKSDPQKTQVVLQTWNKNWLEVVGLPTKLFDFQTCVSINVECQNYDFNKSGRDSPIELEILPLPISLSGSGSVGQQNLSIQMIGSESPMVVMNGVEKCFPQDFRSSFIIANLNYFHVCPTNYVSDLQKFGSGIDCNNKLTIQTASVSSPFFLFVVVLMFVALFWSMTVNQLFNIISVIKSK